MFPKGKHSHRTTEGSAKPPHSTTAAAHDLTCTRARVRWGSGCLLLQETRRPRTQLRGIVSWPVDEQGRLLSQGLPYIDGFCVAPSRWRELNPAHIRPSRPRRTGDQSQRPTRQVEREDLLTIDAFEPETMRAVRAAREQVRLTFEQMQDFW